MYFIKQKMCCQDQSPDPIFRRKVMRTQVGTGDLEKVFNGTCGPEHWQLQPPASAKLPAHQG